MQSIEEIRKEIEELDDMILKLVSKRLMLAKEIGQLKSNLGFKLRDHERELVLKRKWIENASKLGISNELAQELFELVIRYSLRVQLRYFTRKRSVVIVGYGRMAKKLGEIISGAGHHLIITGRNIEKAKQLALEINAQFSDIASAISHVDLVILALNRKGVEQFLNEHSSALYSKIVMDILSTKNGIFDILEQAAIKYGFHYVSTHPLFGPSAKDLDETVTIITSSTSEPVIKEVVEFWESLGLKTLKCNYEEHEKAMAIVQVLPHIFLLSIKRAMDMLSTEYRVDYMKFFTRNVRELYQIITRLEDNYSTIEEIQLNNPFAVHARAIALEALKQSIAVFEKT